MSQPRSLLAKNNTNAGPCFGIWITHINSLKAPTCIDLAKVLNTKQLLRLWKWSLKTWEFDVRSPKLHTYVVLLWERTSKAVPCPMRQFIQTSSMTKLMSVMFRLPSYVHSSLQDQTKHKLQLKLRPCKRSTCALTGQLSNHTNLQCSYPDHRPVPLCGSQH